MANTIRFHILDEQGMDVTTEEDWYLSPDGSLFIWTDDPSYPLSPVNGNYQVVIKQDGRYEK